MLRSPGKKPTSVKFVFVSLNKTHFFRIVVIYFHADTIFSSIGLANVNEIFKYLNALFFWWILCQQQGNWLFFCCANHWIENSQATNTPVMILKTIKAVFINNCKVSDTHCWTGEKNTRCIDFDVIISSVQLVKQVTEMENFPDSFT